jgi:conjugative transposon TraN protein
MKRISAVMITGIILFTINSNTFSQSRIQSFKTTIIEPYHLNITLTKTTNLIFPYPIKSVDRGSRDVLAQKAKGVESILLLKAGRENFTETNLSVITSDGKLYSFIVNYSINPALLNISFTTDTSLEETVPLLQSENNEAQLQLTSEQLAKEKRMLHAIHDNKYKVQFRLNGIYIKGDVVFYQLEIRNLSNINYDIDMLRFFIKDEKKSKRTASQEIEIQPLYVYGDTSATKGQSKNILVFALRKFTIPNRKYLSIQLMEKNGGRHLQLRVHNRTIVKAKLLR